MDDVSLYTMTHADEAPFKVEYERDGKKYTAKLELDSWKAMPHRCLG